MQETMDSGLDVLSWTGLLQVEVSLRNLKCKRPFRAGDGAMGVATSGCQGSLGLKSSGATELSGASRPCCQLAV